MRQLLTHPVVSRMVVSGTHGHHFTPISRSHPWVLTRTHPQMQLKHRCSLFPLHSQHSILSLGGMQELNLGGMLEPPAGPLCEQMHLVGMVLWVQG